MIVSFGGGLASQMDQYAFYKALHFHYPNVKIKMDIFNLFPKEHNGFELDKVFNIKRNECTISEIIVLSDICPPKMKYFSLYKVLNGMRRRLVGIKDSFIRIDDPSIFYKEVFELNPLKSYIFFGNWSNEKYREGIEKDLRTDFTFVNDLVGDNLLLAQNISKENSVSIHIRRGDYSKYGFPMLTLNYYKKAIDIIRQNVTNPIFYLFSDDINYVKHSFSFLKNAIIVSNNCRDKSYLDMQLMSMCKHNIIANSGFSFWGAWLNSNPDKLVIAPKKHVPWCKNTLASHDWIVIDNED